MPILFQTCDSISNYKNKPTLLPLKRVFSLRFLNYWPAPNNSAAVQPTCSFPDSPTVHTEVVFQHL